MPRMYVPEISDTILLTADWTFKLYEEYRNMDVWKAGGEPKDPSDSKIQKELNDIDTRRDAILAPYKSLISYRELSDDDRRTIGELNSRASYLRRNLYETKTITLPVGTVLRIDRIYVRKGSSDFSSLSFYIESTTRQDLMPSKQKPGFKKGRMRFWAKLADVNRIEFDLVSSKAA